MALAPRLFLRELIDVMDRVDIHEDFDPMVHYKLDLNDSKLTGEEIAAKHGRVMEVAEEELEEQPLMKSDKPVESAATTETVKKRLDG